MNYVRAAVLTAFASCPAALIELTKYPDSLSHGPDRALAV